MSKGRDVFFFQRGTYAMFFIFIFIFKRLKMSFQRLKANRLVLHIQINIFNSHGSINHSKKATKLVKLKEI